MIRIFSTALILAASLSGQPIVTGEISSSERSNEVTLIRSAKGLVLVSDLQYLLQGEALDQFEGFEAIGLEVPENKEELASHLKSLYLGKDLTRSSIDQIKASIADYYKEKDYPLVRIEVPKQDVTSGVLQLVLAEGRMGSVEVEGGKWQSSSYLKKIISLTKGEPINEKALTKDLSFLNRNPFRHVDIIYAAGTAIGTTDVILSVEDRRPFRFYSGVDNTGVDTTGRNRYLAGFNGTWIFRQTDHVLSYQYTASLDFHQFQAHTIDYTMLLPWKQALHGYGGVTFVHPQLSLPGVVNHGFSAQASGRYCFPLPQLRRLVHEGTFGYDFKRTNNTFNIVELDFRSGAIVNLSQFMLGYRGNYEASTFKVSFFGELFYSPGQTVSDQSNKSFNTLQPGSVNHYVYGRMMLAYLQRLPKSFGLSVILRGQGSNQILLPSEELGIGGYDTVRGYEERQLNKDNALIANVEIRLPPRPVATAFSRQTKVKDAVEFLVFFDAGLGSYAKPIPMSSNFEYLLGVGPGVRYTLEPYLTCRLDCGVKLHRQAAFGGGSSMIHFSVIGSY